MRSSHRVSDASSAVPLVAVLLLVPTLASAQGKIRVDGATYPRQLTVFDRQGKVVATVGESGNYMNPVLSPDGTKLAVVRTGSRRVSENAVGGDVWVFDVATGRGTRITFDLETGKKAPVWSPDGSQIAYFSFRGDYGGLYRKASDGTGIEELLYTERGVDMPLTDWSADGRFLSFEAGDTLWAVPVSGARESRELLREEFSMHGARFSPDGRFLAYLSDESGRKEVYVRTFDPASESTVRADKWQVSSQGGLGLIQWLQDGRELYYLAADGGVMVVGITATPVFAAQQPTLLFRAPAAFRLAETNHNQCSCDLDACEDGSISRNGQRFVFAVPTSEPKDVVTVASRILAGYPGTYVISQGYEAGREFVVTVEGARLMVQSGRAGKPQEWSAVSESTFVVANNALEFVRDDGGTATHFILSLGVRVERATRK